MPFYNKFLPCTYVQVQDSHENDPHHLHLRSDINIDIPYDFATKLIAAMEIMPM